MQSTYTGAKLGKLDQAKADLLSQAARPGTDAGGGASAAVLMPVKATPPWRPTSTSTTATRLPRT